VVAPIGPPFDQPPVHEALQDPGQRARVQVNRARQVARRHVALAAHEAQHEPLRPGHAEPAFHSLRSAAERVLHLP